MDNADQSASDDLIAGSQPAQPALSSQTVQSRRVFYIPGYDPIHPRRYRELYRSEGAEQARLSGYRLDLKPGSDKGRFTWSVDATIDGHRVNTRVEVLVWADLVRNSMESSILGTYWMLARTAWTYIWSGALRRLMWLRKGPVIAALYPVAMLLAQLLAAIIAGALAGRILVWLVNLVIGLGGLTLSGWPERLFWWPPFIAVAWMLLAWFKRQDRRFFAYYLMHDYAWSARWNGAYPPELETRLDGFRGRIKAALAEPVDEVLVVGHSSGAHLAVSILADMTRKGEVPAGGPVLSFLALGQVIPMVSFLPEAKRLRRDLHDLAAQNDLFWLDISAPGDGCSFALCDPAVVSGVHPAIQTGPLILSAAFSRTLSPQRWKRLRWRFFRLHFQYLCAFDNLEGRPGEYDYFRTTAGPQTLRGRYGARKPSNNRIDQLASPHVSMLTIE